MRKRKFNCASDRLNPIDFIHADSPTAIDDCAALADSLVMRTGMEHERHWDDRCEQTICAVAACIVHHGGGNLMDVGNSISNPQKYAETAQLMTQSDAFDGILAKLGHEMTQPEKKEMAGILSTVTRHFKPFNSPAVAENIKTSSFSPSELVNGRCTVFLVLPVEYLRSHAGLLRMWIAALYRGIVKCGAQEDRLVHFLIDEAATLGHMDAMDDALNIGRGFGIRLKLIYQNIAQLKKCWPDAEQAVHGGCTEVFFGVNDPDTARYVSERLGDATIAVESAGGGGGESWQRANERTYSSNRNWGWQQTGRKLLTAAEVERLPRRTAITFFPGCAPIMTHLARYYERAFWNRQRWPLMRALFDAVLLLVCAGLVALALTRMAAEGSGVTQPSGSADPFTSDYWQMR